MNFINVCKFVQSARKMGFVIDIERIKTELNDEVKTIKDETAAVKEIEVF